MTGNFKRCKCYKMMERIYYRFKLKEHTFPIKKYKHGNFIPFGWICKSCNIIILDNQDVYTLEGAE